MNLHPVDSAALVDDASPATLGELLARPWDEYDCDDLSMLASTYAPHCYLHPDERYLPSTVEHYLTRSELWFDRHRLAREGELDVHALSEWSYARANEQVPDDRSPEECARYKRRHLYLNANPEAWAGLPADELDENAPIYSRVRLLEVDGEELIEIVYVAFFGYNGAYRIAGCVDAGYHQADFEHCTLRVDKHTGLIHSCRFSAHRCVDGYWEVPENLTIVDGTHVVCYIAINGHGFYHQPGRYVRIFGFANDLCGEGILWRPKAVVVSETDQCRLGTATPWLQYDGYWAPNDDKPYRGRIDGMQKQDWWKLELHESNTCLHRFCCFLCCAVCVGWSLRSLAPRFKHLERLSMHSISRAAKV